MPFPHPAGSTTTKRKRGRPPLGSSPGPGNPQGNPQGKGEEKGEGKGQGEGNPLASGSGSFSKEKMMGWKVGGGGVSAFGSGKVPKAEKFITGSDYKPSLQAYLLPTPTPRVVNLMGQPRTFISDELDLPPDAAGDLKIDAQGRLQGGRQYKCPTFSSPFRPDREKLYMLSVDAARCTGHKDSLYFLRAYNTIVKLSVGEEEREALVGMGLMGLKARGVTIVAARSVFKNLGAKIIKDGRHVTDDYYEAHARSDCAEKDIAPDSLVGDLTLPDPSAVENSFQTDDQPEFSFRRGAGGGSTEYAQSSGQSPWQTATWNQRQAMTRQGFDKTNWISKFAHQVAAVNQAITANRRSRESHTPNGLVKNFSLQPLTESQIQQSSLYHLLQTGRITRKQLKILQTKRLGAKGIYDAGTNQIHYKSNTQPTTFEIEQLSAKPDLTSSSADKNALKNWATVDIVCSHSLTDKPSLASHQVDVLSLN